MTTEQIENALKVMYDEIKSLKSKVKKIEDSEEYYTELEEETRKKKRDYWNIDNRPHR
jgi:post-segregation antitoxin (ccd killing protein)